MSALSDDDAARLAVEVWGVPAQLDMVLEECGELIVAIQQNRRGRVSAEAIGEEMADVRIMLEQLEVMFPKVNHKAWRAEKWLRLKGRLSRVERDQGVRVAHDGRGPG